MEVKQMVLIPCNANCTHSKEGYCTLEKITSVTNTAGNCAYYQNKDKNKKALSEGTSERTEQTIKNQ